MTWFRARLCKSQKGCTRLAATSDKVYKLLAHGRWFSPGTPASSITKTGRHDIAEILLKVALNIINQYILQAFGDAYMLVEPLEKAGEVISPFCIQNHTGLDIVMKLDNSFEVSIIHIYWSRPSGWFSWWQYLLFCCNVTQTDDGICMIYLDVFELHQWCMG